MKKEKRTYRRKIIVLGEDGNPISHDFGYGPGIMFYQDATYTLPPEDYDRPIFLCHLNDAEQNFLNANFRVVTEQIPNEEAGQ